MFFGRKRSRAAEKATGEFIAQTLIAAQRNGENVAEVARSIAQSQLDIETGRVQFLAPSGKSPRVHRSSARRRTGTRHTGQATVYSSHRKPEQRIITPR